MDQFSYKKLLSMSAPLMVGTFIQSIVTFTDAIFVSELGTIPFDAFGNGSLVYVSVFMFCRGLADGTQITIAKTNGEERFGRIGATLFNAQLFQLMLSALLIALLFLFGEFIISKISDSPAIAKDMTSFIKVRGWGLLFAAQHMALVGFFIGLGRTNIILFSALLIAVCNIFLDYLFIQGHWGINSMGLIGAPLASSISECVGFLFLLIYLTKTASFKKYNYQALLKKINLRKHFTLIKMSFPLMLQGVFSLTTWLVFFTLVEHMGENALETAHNIRYMYFLAFVPLFGFAASTKTVVSTLVGQNKQQLIPTVIKRLLILSLGFTILIFHGSLLYPETLIKLVNHNADISPIVLSDSVYILKFISGSILLFSLVVIFYNTVSGLGKTQLFFIIEVAAIILYLLGCYFLIYLWNWDIKYVWWIEYIYFITLGTLSFSYFLYYRKKHILNEQ